MSNEHWQLVEAAFERVIAAPPDERAHVLNDACGGDQDLRADVEALLQHDRCSENSFLKSPAILSGVELPPPAALVEAAADAWAASWIGKRVGGYTIERLLASGGMGCVFAARQERPARLVALKLLRPAFAASSALERFRLEPEMLARLDHPNIAKVYEADVHTDERGVTPYFAMELIPDAEPIVAYAAAHNLSTRDKVALFAKVCRAVHHGHQKGIIHRDLKPANLLVGRDGEPKVIDFGVARSTDADIVVTTLCTNVGELVGTMQYMSPEQCEGNSAALDTRTDVYSLGVVLFELLTGDLPYDATGTTIFEATRRIRNEPPRRPSQLLRALRGDLEWIMLKALEKDRDRRYDSAAALADDLDRHLRGEPVTARSPTPAYVIGRYIQRRPWQSLTLLSAGLVALLAIGTVLIWQSREAEAQAHRQARVQAYGAKLVAAEAALTVFDPAAAGSLLAQARASYPDLCGWEWRHLNYRVNQSLWRSALDAAPEFGALPGRLAIAPDGRIAASQNGALVLRGLDGTLLCELVGPGKRFDSVYSVAFSHDGAWLAAFAVDGKLPNGAATAALQVWRGEITTPRPPDATWRIHTWKQTLVFHPKLPIVCASGQIGDREFALQFWDLRRLPNVKTPLTDTPRTPDLEIRGLSDGVEAVAFDRSGKWMATAIAEDNQVQLWDVSDMPASLPRRPRNVLSGHEYHVMDLAFNPSDPHELASAGLDGAVFVWNLRDPDAPQVADVLRAHKSGVTALGYEPEGRRLFTAGLDRALCVWDAAEPPSTPRDPAAQRFIAPSRRVLTNTLRGLASTPRSLRVLADGTLLTIDHNSAIQAWLPDLEDAPRLRGHSSSVNTVAFDERGERLLTSGGHQMMIWDCSNAIPRMIWHDDERELKRARFWSDGDATMMAFSTGPFDSSRPSAVHIARCRPNQQTAQLAVFQASAPNSLLRHVAVSPDHRRVFAAGDSNELLIAERNDAGEWRLEKRLAITGSFVESLQVLDRAGRWVAVSYDARYDSTHPVAIELWDIDAQRVQQVSLRGDPSCSLAVHPDRTQLAAGSTSGRIHVFDIVESAAGMRLNWRQRLEGPTTVTCAIAFHPIEHRLATSSSDGLIRIWDLNTGIEVAMLHGIAVDAQELVFSPDGTTLASGSCGLLGNDNVARLWETGVSSATLKRRALETRAYRELRRYRRFSDEEKRARLLGDDQLADDVRDEALRLLEALRPQPIED